MSGKFGNNTIRPSQLVSTFGPGSVYDNLADSFLIMGTDSWNEESCTEINDEILIQFLKKRQPGKYTALEKFLIPVSPDKDDEQVAIKTFPRWGVCPECDMLQERNHAEEVTRCGSDGCTGNHGGNRPKTVPVRFVAACINGHLDDFPWYRWSHRGTVRDCSPQEAKLYLIDRTNSSSLESKVVECKNCKRQEPMSASMSKEGLRYVLPEGCNGPRPWLRTDDPKPCRDENDEPVYLQGVYKGATNMYFPNTIRSITIPPFADALAKKVVRKIEGTDLLGITEASLNPMIPVLFPDEDVREVLEIMDVLRERRQSEDPPNIREEEYLALNSKRFPDLGTDNEDFKTEPIELPEGFSEQMENLVLVRKLREIVAITGFNRLEPSGRGIDDQRRSESPITNYPEELPRWLPAVENSGEGIFLSFKRKAIEDWSGKKAVSRRFDEILSNDGRPLSSDGVEISQKHMFLHTLSHLLIKEIANYAGYSVSSLRERIYSKDHAAGILIYTSSSSSDGSLGGLVEQGKKPKFNIIMKKALGRSRLCSMDPLCSYARVGTGNRANGHACHACLYLPETSCESMNHFLDRALIQDTLSTGIGLFG